MSSRLAKAKKAEFTPVNEHFFAERNAEISLLDCLFRVNEHFENENNAEINML